MEISKKKPIFKINDHLRDYLIKYDRERELPVNYEDLVNYAGGFPLLDKNDNDTLWESVF